MVHPKRTKYRKYQKGKINGIKNNTNKLQFGKYGIKALSSGRLTASTLEAVRRVITRKCKRNGQMWMRVFPDIVVTQKSAETRMGKGKGSPTYWVCKVKSGQILFELDGISFVQAKQAFLLASYKIPLSTKFVSLH